MNQLDRFLNAMDFGVRHVGAGCWTAKCPAHEDRHPSLSIRETPDGQILIHCFAGCDVGAIVAAVGMELSDLFPDSREPHRPIMRQRFLPATVISLLARELTYIAVFTSDVARDEKWTDDDKQRMRIAAHRFLAAVDVAAL